MTAVNHTGNNHGAGSRANSLELAMRPATDAKHERHKDERDEEDGAIDALAAGEHRRQRSIRYAAYRFCHTDQEIQMRKILIYKLLFQDTYKQSRHS